METTNIDAALNILQQRTAVDDIEQTVKDITFLLKTATNNNDDDDDDDDSHEENQESIEEFTQLVDVPLHSTIDNTIKSTADSKSKSNPKKYYFQSNHNREGDSYRSPWTNEYDPPLPVNHSEDDDDEEIMMGSSFKPSSSLRELEIQANDVFESYTQLYYGANHDDSNGNRVVSSVFFWDKDGSGGSSNNNVFKKGFGGCFLIEKQIDIPNVQKGVWNSIHHVDFGPIVNGRSCKYGLSTTIVLSMDVIASADTAITTTTTTSAPDGKNSIHIGVSLSEEVTQTKPINKPTDHIMNIGQMVEDVEIKLRTNMDAIYIQKTKEIIDSIRPSDYVGGSFGQQRSSRGSAGGGRGGGLAALMMGGGMSGLPPAAQNEMNAALMARFKKSNPS